MHTKTKTNTEPPQAMKGTYITIDDQQQNRRL